MFAKYILYFKQLRHQVFVTEYPLWLIITCSLSFFFFFFCFKGLHETVKVCNSFYLVSDMIEMLILLHHISLQTAVLLDLAELSKCSFHLLSHEKKAASKRPPALDNKAAVLLIS